MQTASDLRACIELQWIPRFWMSLDWDRRPDPRGHGHDHPLDEAARSSSQVNGPQGL